MGRDIHTNKLIRFLDSELSVEFMGSPVDKKYRAESDGTLLRIYQPFRDGFWGCVGTWSAPFADPSDTLYLDYGQDWKVKGMLAVHAEITKLIEETVDA